MLTRRGGRSLALAALVALVGCERADRVGAYRIELDVPSVGNRSTFDMRTEARMSEPDGSERVRRSHLAYSLTVLEVEGEHVVAARVVIEEDVHLFDFPPNDRLVGPYLLRRNADGTVTATREDQQPLNRYESEALANWSLGLSPAERAELRRRAYRTGERFEPTPLEFRVLLGELDDHRNVELAVTAASPEAMSFVLTYERLGAALTATMRGTVSKGHTQLSGDLLFRDRDGKPWRRLHVELRGDDRGATSPRPE